MTFLLSMSIERPSNMMQTCTVVVANDHRDDGRQILDTALAAKHHGQSTQLVCDNTTGLYPRDGVPFLSKMP